MREGKLMWNNGNKPKLANTENNLVIVSETMSEKRIKLGRVLFYS